MMMLLSMMQQQRDFERLPVCRLFLLLQKFFKDLPFFMYLGFRSLGEIDFCGWHFFGLVFFTVVVYYYVVVVANTFQLCASKQRTKGRKKEGGPEEEEEDEEEEE